MFLLPDDRTAQIKLAPVNLKGVAEPVENVEYVSSDVAIATVDASGIITPVAHGNVTISVTADAQIGDGVSTLVDVIEIQVASSQAVKLDATVALI